MNKSTKQLSGIYKIICLANNKFYIGSSENIDKRLKNHIRLLKNNKHFNPHLQNAWYKYKEENFRFEIVETVHDIKQLLIREKWWIDKTNCCNRKIGFNISSSPQASGRIRLIDLTGKIFGRLTVKERAENSRGGQPRWLCKCNCGNERIIEGGHLRENIIKSCGCLRREGNNLKHGHNRKNKKSKTFVAWKSMLSRCNNKNNKKYKIYGNRGVTICDRWLEPKGQGFLNFLKDVGEIPKGKSLCRIDTNKLINGYSLENCQLLTTKEQSNRRRKKAKRYEKL